MTTTDPFIYTETDHYREAVAYLDALGPLPAADTIAAPLVRAFSELYYAFQDRADTIEAGLEHGAFITEGVQIVDTAYRVAGLVATEVQSMLTTHQAHHAFGEAARSIVMTIANVAAVESVLYWSTRDAMNGRA